MVTHNGVPRGEGGDFRKKGSKILKLPSVRNCFTLAMTNKLIVVINSLKLPKIKKILLYEMKFLVPNYSCIQNPWLLGYRSQILVLSVLCPQLNFLNSPTPNKILGYVTGDTWPRQFIGEKRHLYGYLFITCQITVNSVYEQNYIKLTAQFTYVTALTVSLKTHLLTLKCTTFVYTVIPRLKSETANEFFG